MGALHPACQRPARNIPDIMAFEVGGKRSKGHVMSKDNKADGDEAFERSSATTFGRSVESHAQVTDAESRASPLPGMGETLHLYRLVPTAPADDPRWQNSPYQGEVLVAARTTGDARIVAAGRELDFMEIDSAPADDVTTITRVLSETINYTLLSKLKRIEPIWYAAL